MTIKRFIAFTLGLAGLIVAGFQLSLREQGEPSTVIEFSGLVHADPYFIVADSRDKTIECPVRFGMNQDAYWRAEPNSCSLGDGWLLPGKWGSNIFGKRAQVHIELSDAMPRVLAIRLRASQPLPTESTQTLRLLVNGTAVGQHTVSRTWHNLQQPIPENALIVGRNELSLEFAHAVSPREAGFNKDYRALSATIERLALSPAEQAASAPTHRAAPTNVWDAERQGFAIRESGTLVLPLLIPHGAPKLEFGLHPSRSVDPDTFEVVLASEDLDGGHRRQTAIKGRSIRDEGRIALPVNNLEGRWLLVTATVSIDGGEVLISPPRFLVAPGPETAAPPPPSAPKGASELPDIVLITLDAARADRFSFAGHHRRTTPFIDSIAEESLAFSNAYALAPYTLCSVPTMITGLSFLDHSVVKHEDVLSDDAVTLAEILRDRGYLTAGFSATPNNSKVKGFAQGYEVFREIWTEGPAKKWRRGHYVAQQVVDWLESEADGTRPLHLQVHMVPPHAPYDPLTEFDLFTDPAYDGPCDGFKRTMSAIDGRESPATAECVEHILNLYDGNLREADDATRVIVEALQRRPRWENTVVLITSDHGEAFGEHGWFEHNSTVNKEMLHVPFVLRTPPSIQKDTIDTDRLVTLADIVPTLLGTAGIKTTEDGDGVDLLASDGATEGRHMITRSTTRWPYMGLRTMHWSLIVNTAGSGALYDLAVDPGELDNVSPRHSVPYVGLGRILKRRIGLPSRLRAAAETADITETEKAQLEALGYIRD